MKTLLKVEVNKSESIGLNVMYTKIICIIMLGVVSLITGVLPLIMSLCLNKNENDLTITTNTNNKISQKNYILQLAMSFAGGVLFATVFVHLLPEVNEVFENLSQTENYKNLPEYMPQALMTFGFFLMYFVEEIVHMLASQNKVDNEQGNDEITFKKFSNNTNRNDNPLEGKLNISINSLEEKYRSSNISAIHQRNDDDDERIDNATFSTRDTSFHHHDHHEIDLLNSHKTGSAIRSFVLAVALCVHGLFEGMAIGLEKESSDVWLMLLGVGAHKAVLSFCMGVEMVASGGAVSRRVQLLYLSAFALVSPVGIGLGIFLSSNSSTEDGSEGDSQEFTATIFQGIASGTLLYVLFFEVMQQSNNAPNENDSKNSCRRFTLFAICLVGFLVMAALQMLGND